MGGHVLVRDVGDDRYVEITPGETLLRQPLRRRLQDSVRRARRDHVVQIALHISRMRRGGVQACIQVQRADPRVNGADHPCFTPGGA